MADVLRVADDPDAVLAAFFAGVLVAFAAVAADFTGAFAADLTAVELATLFAGAFLAVALVGGAFFAAAAGFAGADFFATVFLATVFLAGAFLAALLAAVVSAVFGVPAALVMPAAFVTPTGVVRFAEAADPGLAAADFDTDDDFDAVAGLAAAALEEAVRPAVVAEVRLAAVGDETRLAVVDAAAGDTRFAAARPADDTRFAAAEPAGFATAARLVAAEPAGFVAAARFAVPAVLAAGLAATDLVGLSVPTGAAVVRVAVVDFFPVRAAGLVGAFLTGAIEMFLLANDCGLVSAWRLTSSGLDKG